MKITRVSASSTKTNPLDGLENFPDQKRIVKTGSLAKEIFDSGKSELGQRALTRFRFKLCSKVSTPEVQAVEQANVSNTITKRLDIERLDIEIRYSEIIWK